MTAQKEIQILKPIYRYIGELEKQIVEKDGKIDTPEDIKEKYFSPDGFYSSGYKSQSYLALPCKPVYRIGPIDVKTIQDGKIIPQRAWAAFGHHGGGWEITLKVPISYECHFHKIDVQSFCEHMVANEYFETLKSEINKRIKSIAEKVKNEISDKFGDKEIKWDEGPFEEPIVKEGGFIKKFNLRRNLPPFEFTISILLNTLTEPKQFMIWVSGWWDYDESLIDINNYANLYDYFINNQKLKIFREWFTIGPEYINKPAKNVLEKCSDNWWEKFNRKIETLLKKAIPLYFCIPPCFTMANKWSCGLKGSVIVLPKLSQEVEINDL